MKVVNMGKVISIVGQKGGGSKSTKARTLAVGFTEAGWKTHLADIDTKQQTSEVDRTTREQWSKSN
jgi:chromosome partitioning protein